MADSSNIATLLGITQATRQEAVEALFLTTERNPAVYWLQLLIAAGIAHLGLVLNSTAVVIGAMLVSPLMTPIVQVGMAFAIGNLFLTLKALSRVVMSILLVVMFAAVMTKTMPFQEVTSEILARTQPTALDLNVAFFCGLAAAFTVSKGSRDTVTAAAGTAIAIALVPPLCVLGFGVGVGSVEIVWGATLLFTANFAAIILVSDVYFLITGFANIEIDQMENSVLREKDTTSRLFRAVKRVKLPINVSRWRFFRLLLPSLFVVSVFFPLSQALERVTWEVYVKKGINEILTKFEKDHQVLSRYQSVSHDSLAVQLTIVGEPGSEKDLTQDLRLSLATLSGVDPKVSILVIPSSKYMDEKLMSATTLPQLEAAKANQAIPFAMTAQDAVVNMSTVLLRDSLRLSLEKVMGWMRDNDADGAWLNWSLVLGNRSTEILVQRLAEADLPEATRAFMSGVLQRETGLHAEIRENRIPRTLYQGTDLKEFLLAGTTTQAHLREALSDPLITVVATHADMNIKGTTRQKRDRKKMDDAFSSFVTDMVPAERLEWKDGGEVWSLKLRRRVRKEKAEPAPDAAPSPTPAASPASPAASPVSKPTQTPAAAPSPTPTPAAPPSPSPKASPSSAPSPSPTPVAPPAG